MKIIFSSSPIKADFKVINPRMLTHPDKAVTELYLNGSFPEIRAIYEAAGVPVRDISEYTRPAPVAKPTAKRRRKS